MNNLVFKGQNNQALTNSLLVAEKFGKEHSDVLKAIDALCCKMAENQCKGYFADTSIEIPQPNGGVRHSRIVVMTRDGFTLLAMGFTGEKALKFKLDYINAFNQMEETIKSGGHHVPGQPPQSFVCRGGGDITTLLPHWRAGKNPQSKRNQDRAK